ncbi:MAG TPA: hypothetical protein EYQ74_01480 [Planctomycetes bacterium]|nr:hypothetical protein [Planctomycetota bacterium]HIK61843.1 hypothetical protein [Planctomycetota bacterium]
MSTSPTPQRLKLLPLAGVGVVLLIQGWVSIPAKDAAIPYRVDTREQQHAPPTLERPRGEARISLEPKSGSAMQGNGTSPTGTGMTEPGPILELPTPTNAFLSTNLRVVGEVFPEMYNRYLSAPPRMRAKLAHALQTYSMTIILSASGEGPLPEGHPMEGVLTGAGLFDLGRSAFHINGYTFQYHVDRFPEIQQYRRNRAGQRRFGLIGVRPLPLSSTLDQAIIDRAAEAFSYLN